MPKKAPIPTPLEIRVALTNAIRRTAVRPSIAGYKPMEHQIGFHSSPARGRAFIGGNRSGKTVAGGAEAVYWLKGQHPYRPVPPAPVRGRGVAVDFDHGVDKIMLPEIARWIPPSLLIDGSWDKSYSKAARTLTLTNGSFMEFLSTDQDLDKHAGTSRHFVWFDEEPPKSYYGENMARLIDTAGSWWLTMTPLDGMTWVYDDIYLASIEGLNPNIQVFLADTTQNIHINATEIDLLLQGLSEDEKKARREGKFIQLGGLVYAGKYFTQANIIPSLYESERWAEIKKSWIIIQGMDHGFKNPTCFLWAAFDHEGRIIVFDEYYQSGLVVANHAANVKEKNRLLNIDPAYIVGDPSIRNTDPITGTSVQMEYIDKAEMAIILGNNDVKAGINRVAAGFSDSKIFVTENCRNLIWELNRYRWARWANKKVEDNRNDRDEPVKKDDHACDALRYLVASRFMPELEDVAPKAQNVLNSPTPLIADTPRLDNVPEYEPDVYVDSYLGSDW